MYATVVTANRARFPEPGAVISAGANLRRGPTGRLVRCCDADGGKGGTLSAAPGTNTR